MAAERIETRLTVIDVQRCQGVHGKWTELEAWWWRRGNARPLRYLFRVNGWQHVLFGDLVAVDPQDAHRVVWWNHRTDRRPGWLLLVSAVEQLPALTL